MFPKIADWQAFTIRVALICNLILESVKQVNPCFHLISVDEKTSIQALSRVEGVAPKSKGGHRRMESEYTRNGTTCLIAAIDVGTGSIVHQRIHPTRTEEDFAIFIEQMVSGFPADHEVVILADQLNTHLSESLVKLVAKQIKCLDELGLKGKTGILKSQESRRAFLEEPTHRVRFVFTPKHCSWLNPVENWFAKLQRHVIKNGNFPSVENLVEKMEKYITYYNKYLVKPLKWKFKGFIKAQELKKNDSQETPS